MEIVNLQLEDGVSSITQGDPHRTALQSALSTRDLETVNMVLGRNRDIVAKADFYRLALQSASLEGNK